MNARPREFASLIGKTAWYSGEWYQRPAASMSANSVINPLRLGVALDQFDGAAAHNELTAILNYACARRGDVRLIAF
jgi:hypothetical protein